MKCRLLNLLACPACGEPNLDLQVFEIETTSQPSEVKSGVLLCKKCGGLYPVVDGIPRMLPDSADEHAKFLDRFGVSQHARRRVAPRQLTTFTFEGLRYSVPSFDENRRFFEDATGMGASDLAGRTVLEVGCGMGRFMEVAASLGAYVVGLNLSRSVERAQKSERFSSQVDVVQGDLMNPPFRMESFDAVYSIGVLHHTPNTREAFRSISSLVRPGGRTSILVYRMVQPEVSVSTAKRAFANAQEWVSDRVRLLTTRLPHRALHGLCFASVPLGWIKCLAETKSILKIPLAPFLLLPISAHPNWRVRLCDTFDWLAPRHQWKHTTAEVLNWFQAEGFIAVRPLSRSVSVTGVRPVDAVPRREISERVEAAVAYAGRGMERSEYVRH